MAKKTTGADQLKQLLGRPQAPPPDHAAPAAAPAHAVIVQGRPYQAGYRDDAIVLPASAEQLSASLREKALLYLGARRRTGEALLEAARWMAEARAEARHGEWATFLVITDTSDDAAERLVNIHTQAMQNPQFAESVRSNWLSPSAAGLLARPSTPPAVVTEVLSDAQPPKVVEVERKIRQARRKESQAQNPQFAEFDAPAGVPPAISALEMLQETAKLLAHLARFADELPATVETEHVIARAEQSLAAIRQALHERA